MKEINLVLLIACFILFNACNNEDVIEPAAANQTSAPVLKATMGQLTDVNPPNTRSGVIEDNPDYAAGEQFYWVNGDQVKMLFFENGDLNTTPTELIYTAVVAEGQKSNACTFTADGGIPAGQYTIYGLYPASGWSKDDTGYKASVNWWFTQADVSSKHLGTGMFMKAKTEATIVGNSNNEINLSFKHLASVVRFHIVNKNYPEYQQLGSFTMYLRNYSSSPPTYTEYFPTQAYLEGGIDGESLTPVESSREYLIFVDIRQNLIEKGNGPEFDVYIPVLPTGATTDPNDRISLEGGLSDETGNQLVPHFGIQNGLSFTNDIPFLVAGFEAGKSYYFNLTDWR